MCVVHGSRRGVGVKVDVRWVRLNAQSQGIGFVVGWLAWVENSAGWQRSRKHVDGERNCFGGGFVDNDDLVALTLLTTFAPVAGLEVQQHVHVAIYFEVEITNDVVLLPCLPVVFNRSKRGFLTVCSAVSWLVRTSYAFEFGLCGWRQEITSFIRGRSSQ